MQDLMIQQYVKTQSAMAAFVQRQQQVLKGERGASALEYIGMVVVAVILVGIVLKGIQGAGLEGKITSKINEIFALK